MFFSRTHSLHPLSFLLPPLPHIWCPFTLSAVLLPLAPRNTYRTAHQTYPLLFFFLTTQWAFRILVPWPGIEPVPPTVEAQSPNHWTTGEVPKPTLSWQLEPIVFLHSKYTCSFFPPPPKASSCFYSPQNDSQWNTESCSLFSFLLSALLKYIVIIKDSFEFKI